jgi:hypothetical protein
MTVMIYVDTSKQVGDKDHLSRRGACFPSKFVCVAILMQGHQEAVPVLTSQAVRYSGSVTIRCRPEVTDSPRGDKQGRLTSEAT